MTGLASPRLAVLFSLGLGSSLPLYLTGQTLQAWLSTLPVDLGRISALSLVGLAYTLKFLWAPLLDRYRLPFLGRRRGWMLALQVGLVIAVGVMGLIDPVRQPEALVVAAVVVAFLSASLDVVIDAYNADVLPPEQRTAGASAYVLGYRMGLVMSGALAMVLATHVSWTVIYFVMAALIGFGAVATLLAEEPARTERPPARLLDALVTPVTELWHRLGAARLVLVLGFVAVYKFGDYFAQAVVIAFLHRGAGFALDDIGLVYQALGFVGTGLGATAAAVLGTRLGMRRALIAFGLLQATTNLTYAALAVVGTSFPMFCVAVLADNLMNAMGTAVFVAFLMSVCSPAVSATQFALLTSLSSVGQRVFGVLTDDLVASVGWPTFFVATSAMAIPGIVLAYWVTRANRRMRPRARRTRGPRTPSGR